jgi:DNA mismatch repair protein MutL
LRIEKRFVVPDVIQLLSDHIANQIAAGEVIQRPASAVKELLENAIDAGATEIALVIKDAGKELIQVIDNGKGMSPTDARMAFERHATSKIKSIEDLFAIRTMGFRGEALASIAAVTQVELKTRQQAMETGTRIVIEGTEVKHQEACATPVGTNISVKNLLFNVPARRHFLKSTTTELRHIIDEFTRIALAYPQIKFRFFNNGVEQFHLESGSLKMRITALLGGNYEKNLVPVEESTDWLSIKGFIGKPEAATRTRGMQFFFINNRFIRNAFLNHALTQAYDSMIEKDAYPFYVLFMETDPSRVDVNVHPTKQEVKFEDDRMMYSYLNAAVRHALARYNIAPSIDFTLNPAIQHLPAVELPVTEATRREAQDGYLYQTFTGRNQAHVIERNDSLSRWKDLYEVTKKVAPQPQLQSQQLSIDGDVKKEMDTVARNIIMLHGAMLAASVKSGMMLLHIRRALERIWYERLLQEWNEGNTASQQLLFPISFELSPPDAMLLSEMIADLARIGFDISPFGQNAFVIQGIPSGLSAGEEKNVIHEVLERLKNESPDPTQRAEVLLIRMARRLSLDRQSVIQPEGQQALIDELFACTQPELTPTGKKVFIMIKKEELEKMLD